MSLNHEGSAAHRIEALPSYWRGNLFRSRTEARWAVFFDAVGLRWEYEPEGFKLSDGTWYLPDFWLPEMKMWAEVKPDDGPTDEENDKGRLLVLGSGHPLIFLPGAPWPDSYPVLRCATHEGETQVIQDRGQFSKKYTIDRHDGAPRLFMLWGSKSLEDPWISDAARTARSMELTEPDAGRLLPAGWEGIDVPVV